MTARLRTASLLVGMVLTLAAGCAKKAHQVDDKLNDPPAETAVAPLPDGPPIVHTAPANDVAPADVSDDAADATVTRAQVEAFRNRGPAYVLTVVQVEPVHAQQGFVGFQISEVTAAAQTFMTPQLQVGDVVTHINGVRLMRPDDLMEAWRSLDNAQSIRVDFSRSGEPLHAQWAVK